MGTIASQITSFTIVYSIVYSDADHRKHQSSASLAFVCGIHRGPVNSPHKWPVTRKMFPFDDVVISWSFANNMIQSGTVLLISQLSCPNLAGNSSVNTFSSDHFISLQWRHNEHDRISNLLNRLFRRRSKETPKLRTTGLCAENSPVTGEFPADRASNAETVSVWWRLHVCKSSRGATTCFYLDTRHTRLIIRVKSRGLGYMIF